MKLGSGTRYVTSTDLENVEKKGKRVKMVYPDFIGVEMDGRCM